MTDETHVLEATNEAGEFVYYTGRAGAGWLSTELADAFRYTETGAARAIATLSCSVLRHGLRFEALSFPSRAAA